MVGAVSIHPSIDGGIKHGRKDFAGRHAGLQVHAETR